MKKYWIIIFGSLLYIGMTVGIVYIYVRFLFGMRVAIPKRDYELGIGVRVKSEEANEDSPGVLIRKNNVPVIDFNINEVFENPEQHVDEIKEKEITNIAFFGLDRRNPNENSRSDTIMVVTIDRKNKKVKVTSIMRDMYVPIPDKKDNRINAAYALGGPVLAIRTINSNFSLNIRDYVTVDFWGLIDVIDSIGGIEIYLSKSEAGVLNDWHIDFGDNGAREGLQMLNGQQALAYSRIRSIGYSDFDRTERQRKVLNEILKKIKKRKVAELPETISSLLPFVETSLPNAELLRFLIMAVNFNTDNIEQFRLPVDGTYSSQKIRGMMVLVPDIEQNRTKLHEFIKE